MSDNTMTDEKLSTLKSEVYEALCLNRQRLVVTQPFIGGILMHFGLVPIRDKRCFTACTDGNNVYFDIDFYMRLNDKERVFVLAHECWHCVYLHFLRCRGRIKEVWNIATDCEINQMLKESGFIAPPNLCFPERCDIGKNAEEIYERLLKKMKKDSKKNKDNGSDGDNGKSDSKENGEDKSNKNENGNSEGKLEGQFDKHITKDGGNGGNGDESETSDRWGEKGFDEDFNPSISDDVGEKVRSIVISEAQKTERRQGTIPAGVERIIAEYKNPEIPWREVLAQEITKCYSDRYEWLPVNRRYVHRGLYLPSRHGEKIKVTVAIDTSGSCESDIPKFMGEVVGLLESFSNYEMNFIQCDCAVKSCEKYDDSNPFPIEECNKLKFKGFGGTSFCPVFDYIEKNMYEDNNLLIYLTDGYGDAPKNPPPYNVLWVLTSDGCMDFCDWGMKLRFKDKKQDV